VEPWGRRKLAYPVRKVREGQYVLLRTQLQQQAIGELERNLKLNENVIRHLLVRVGE
jgi:small subunit ribosomal protein S6